MKITGINLLIITSFVLVLLAVVSALEFSFSLVFILMCIGQLLLIFTVYKVLTDDYTTNKTFEDFYEDYTPNENE
ncbi:hypothetical protein [Gillisia sp. CAL575]|uniref:hypothetical protein n=1 Tax=Gillisia sp. CAL575 TaxID=985255 RepID=UPI000556F0DD|nr:hypothetical protein [Gillisia sp. CAL575]